MKRERLITNILLGLIAILLAIYLYVILSQRGVLEIKINSAVKSSVADEFKKLQIPDMKNIKSGYTPKKGVDYFDGVNGNDATNEQVQEAVEKYFAANPVKNGENGVNGSDAPIPVKGVDYFDGTNGFTPIIRCNVNKNRWEVRYSIEASWQLMNNDKVPCTVGG